jgi:gluconate 2-dehydrogenase alpha chain
MSQIINHNAVDVVVLGMGVTSGTVAVELAKAGYKVVGLERGPHWSFANDFYYTKYDEWGIGFMRKFDISLAITTATLRNNSSQFALPIRRNSIGYSGQIISEGWGVGGMAQHYGGVMGRYAPWVYQMYSDTVNKYGLDFLNAAVPHQDLIDWPMTYDDYKPYYEQWEKMWGVCGTNEGPLLPGFANYSYPLPPSPTTPVATEFKNAAEALGYNPFPLPVALASQAFVNPYGVGVQQCMYDGWCAGPCNYTCETGAKANSDFRTVPAAISTGNFELRTNSYVFRLDTDGSGNVTQVRYYDEQGNINIQPGKVFFNGLWGHNIVKLMLHSGIGNPYNPANATGSLGRGIAMGVPPPVRLAIGTLNNIGGNGYPAGNGYGGGYTMRDLADDNFDHKGLNFIGGAYPFVGTYLGGGPNNFAFYADQPTPDMIGGTFKASLKDAFLPTKTTMVFAPSGISPPVTDWYVDLDPHYSDRYGDPLPRLTLDWTMNEVNCANYLAPKFADILTKMGASNVQVSPVVTTASHNPAWQAHMRGGARIGSDPATSVFNKWQQCWTSHNLFAAGEICKPTGDNTTAGTHPIGPMSYVAAEGIKKYLASPGPLV